MDGCGLIHPDVRPMVEDIIRAPYVFPEDIIDGLRREPDVWANYVSFPEPYKRIRVAYIDAARGRPDEFRKRLDNFVFATRKGRIISGYGGVGKYYGTQEM